MEIGNLIRMANRIGQFFEAMPDRQEAGEGVANHIHKFWEPRMRTQLLDFLAGQPTAKPAGNAASAGARGGAAKPRPPDAGGPQAGLSATSSVAPASLLQQRNARR